MGRIKWPPKLVRTDMLGEVKDVSNRKVNRDVGRPVWLGGNTYYAFGDSFCHDHQGEFHGVSNTTLAYVPEPAKDPLKSQYLDGNMKVKEYMPFTKSEWEYDSHPEHKKKNDRMVLWSFGGIVEDTDGCGTGWTMFDKMLTHGADPGHHYGMGIARVSVQPDKSIKVDRIMGDEMLFGPDDVKFGCMSTLIDDDGWVYFAGSWDPNPKQFDLRTHVCRIRRDADFTKRENYEFFVNSMDMKGMWTKSYNHIDDLKRLGDLDVQAMGNLFKAPNFAPEGKPYMWVGSNKFMVGHLYVGCSPSPTGPWEVHDLGEVPNDPHPWDGKSSGPKYGIYPNEKASDFERGEILAAWTDAAQMGGKVLMARFWLETEDGQGPPPAPVQEAGKHHGHGGIGGKLKGKLGEFLK